ncbi:MAG: EamA family transporter [Thiobacillus sp.]|uniref:EamA family transporter n=1 Tax=Thiobacillus sp. 0-1251 TaxID=1895858 RepID=UPI0025D7F618|nr:EamA family transporter [Thiobacillus sp. 0-1251]
MQTKGQLALQGAAESDSRLWGASLPAWFTAGAAMAVGLLGYGLSLVLFVRALRNLGTARSGAYFSTAPFIGAAITILLLGEPTPAPFWVAASLMGIGVWLQSDRASRA